MHDQNYGRKISVLDWGIVISAILLLFTVYLPFVRGAAEGDTDFIYTLEVRVGLAGLGIFRVELAGLLEPLDGVFLLIIFLVGIGDVDGGVGRGALVGSGLVI